MTGIFLFDGNVSSSHEIFYLGLFDVNYLCLTWGFSMWREFFVFDVSFFYLMWTFVLTVLDVSFCYLMSINGATVKMRFSFNDWNLFCCCGWYRPWLNVYATAGLQKRQSNISMKRFYQDWVEWVGKAKIEHQPLWMITGDVCILDIEIKVRENAHFKMP